jgi:hypothetical protein
MKEGRGLEGCLVYLSGWKGREGKLNPLNKWGSSARVSGCGTGGLRGEWGGG